MMFSKHLFKKGSFTLQKSSIEKTEPSKAQKNRKRQAGNNNCMSWLANYPKQCHLQREEL